MAKEPKKHEFTSKKGNKYTFQKVRNSVYLDMMDNCTSDTGKPVLSKLYAAILENIVVVPAGLTVDDFDDFKELQEVCESALTFQQG